MADTPDLVSMSSGNPPTIPPENPSMPPVETVPAPEPSPPTPPYTMEPAMSSPSQEEADAASLASLSDVVSASHAGPPIVFDPTNVNPNAPVPAASHEAFLQDFSFPGGGHGMGSILTGQPPVGAEPPAEEPPEEH